MIICLRLTAYKMNTNIRNLMMVLTKKREEEVHIPFFRQRFISLCKTLKICPRDIIFPFKQEDMCDYNPLCFMSSQLMLDSIIMNLFSDITKQTTDSVKKDLFSNIQDDIIYFYKGYLQDYS